MNRPLLLLLMALLATGTIAFVPLSPRVKALATTKSSILLATPTDTNNHAKPITKVKKQSSGSSSKHCIPLEKICLEDLPKVGGKTASLGELIQELTPLGVKVPGGFAVSSTAYDAVLDRYQLRERLELLLEDVDGKPMQYCT